MSETIQQSELRNNNAEIMRRVAAGESFTVTVHGTAVADIVPHQRGTRRRRFVPTAEIDALLAADRPDAQLWEQDLAALDEVVDDDYLGDPWSRGTQ